jgi:hypothetical protein
VKRKAARSLPSHAEPVPDPAPAPQRKIERAPLMSRAELIAMHVELQQQLALYGIVQRNTDLQHELDRELMRAYQIEPFGDALDAQLEELHREAYPGPHRPPRLLARDGVVELADILVDQIVPRPSAGARGGGAIAKERPPKRAP